MGSTDLTNLLSRLPARSAQVRRWSVYALALGLSGCGGYSPVVFPAVTAPDMLTRVVANPNFKAVDGTSFANAAMLYPTRVGTSHHSIPVGDYLVSRIVLALPPNAAISALRLTEYRSVCRPSGFVSPQARCATKATFQVETPGGAKSISVESEVDTGPLYVVGDISPPFTWGDMPVDAIHQEARKSIDALEVAMRASFSRLAR